VHLRTACQQVVGRTLFGGGNTFSLAAQPARRKCVEFADATDRHHLTNEETVLLQDLLQPRIRFVVDLIACERSTFGNDCILNSFFSFILTSNKFRYNNAFSFFRFDGSRRVAPCPCQRHLVKLFAFFLQNSRGKGKISFNHVCGTRKTQFSNGSQTRFSLRSQSSPANSNAISCTRVCSRYSRYVT
jgi:hypothetical protein